MFFISDSFDPTIIKDEEKSGFKLSMIRIGNISLMKGLISKMMEKNTFKSLIKTKKNAALFSKELGIEIPASDKENSDPVELTIVGQFLCGIVNKDGTIAWYTISRLS